MRRLMTKNTHRNNVKPMFGRITFIMMVLLSRFTTKTYSRRYMRQFSSRNSMINSISSFYLGIIFTISRIISSSFFALSKLFTSAINNSLTLFCSFVSFMRNFTKSFCFLCFRIYTYSFFHTYFALIQIVVFHIDIFIKFIKPFCLFAFCASFRYDFSSHFCLLIRRLWLEPVAAHTAVGSFYYSNLRGKIK